MSLIELLGISGFKANPDRVLTVEALTRLKTLIRIGFLCKDVSIEEICCKIEHHLNNEVSEALYNLNETLN